jgi:hypothetical protein
MAISDFGNELLVTNQSGVTYDLNKDYSKAIAAAKAAGQDTALLEAQRQAKINSAAYGGQYKTGAESSSLGSIYNENATISNRTSNASPIIVNSTIQEMADPLSNTAEYLKQMYANNTAAELAALKSTYEQNVADVEANVPKINEMYQAARNETAAQSEIDKRNFAEYAAARALNTGTSGQAELARQVSLTGNLAGISGQEKNALADNELQKQQLTIAYRNAIDEATAQGNAALAQALYGEYVRQIEANTAQSNLDREYASNLSYAMLQAGMMPDAGTLSAAGIGATDANAIAAYYKQLAAQQAVKKASSGGGGNDVGSMTLSNAKLMAEAGQFTDAVLAAFKKAGFTDEYLADTYGYDPNATVQEEASAAGINESRFNQLGQAVNQFLAQGMGQSALDYLNGVWETLSRDQQDRIKAQFNRYGIVIE